jgi:Holliday junction resolvase RusA-like endonuclease
MKTISFFVSGDPQPQPRPRARAFGKFAQVYDASAPNSHDKGKAYYWRTMFTVAAKTVRPPAPITGQVWLTMEFYLRRPKVHYNKKGLKPGAPASCCSKPDIDNLAKLALDAMRDAGLFADDSQVVDLHARKFYADVPDQIGCDAEMSWMETGSPINTST